MYNYNLYNIILNQKLLEKLLASVIITSFVLILA